MSSSFYVAPLTLRDGLRQCGVELLGSLPSPYPQRASAPRERTGLTYAAPSGAEAWKEFDRHDEDAGQWKSSTVTMKTLGSGDQLLMAKD